MRVVCDHYGCGFQAGGRMNHVRILALWKIWPAGHQRINAWINQSNSISQKNEKRMHAQELMDVLFVLIEKLKVAIELSIAENNCKEKVSAPCPATLYRSNYQVVI